ncbi:hypothetical protein FRX31_016249 [Thalictrum thalictroides]|uniref:Uncharacterized protein n=1 Tax=Thalictrum thalictroides TaxID=46969 RepID=A0A7J6W9Q9_THATH|nr:hypothetical protein FRX31_016249 [Thalictrum thalictroides]
MDHMQMKDVYESFRTFNPTVQSPSKFRKCSTKERGESEIQLILVKKEEKPAMKRTETLNFEFMGFNRKIEGVF